MLVPPGENSRQPARIVITDFGLARLDPIFSSGEHSVTHHSSNSNQPIGTLAYMAPEQMDGGPISAATDQTAADAIKDPHLLTNLNQGIGPTFPPGSIIAKAIWGIFPFSDPSTLMPHKEGFASIIRSDQEDSWSKNDGNSQLLPDLISAARHFAGRTPAWTFPLDGNTHFADECQSTVLPGQLPWNCIFYMSVDASAPSFNVGAGRVIRQDTAAGLTINGNCAKQKQCYVALLGIHFMIRPGSPRGSQSLGEVARRMRTTATGTTLCAQISFGA